MWKCTVESAVYDTWKEYGNYRMSLLIPGETDWRDNTTYLYVYVLAVSRFYILKKQNMYLLFCILFLFSSWPFHRSYFYRFIKVIKLTRGSCPRLVGPKLWVKASFESFCFSFVKQMTYSLSSCSLFTFMQYNFHKSSEMNLEPSRISIMEFFVKIIND